MKAVAVALVLIAGAAVVLWYGNTSNSWVVGGLIGGLAALLLSIPISLSLFSYLSHRHDERTRAEEALVEEERYLIDDRDPRFFQRSARRAKKYIESSIYNPEREFDQEKERDSGSQVPQQRRLPAGRRLPITEQDSAPMRDIPGLPPPASKAQTRDLNGVSKEPERTLPRRKQYPGLPASDSGVSRSKQQSQALHTARLEANRDAEENVSWSTQSGKRYTPGRMARSRMEQEQKAARRTRQLAEQESQIEGRQRVSGQVTEDFSEREEERLARLQRRKERRAETSGSHYGATKQVVPPGEYSAQGTRHPHLEQEYLPAEEETDEPHGTRPLIRRAPYLYDDDPLRQELFQHIETPVVRRSSRNDPALYEDEEEE